MALRSPQSSPAPYLSAPNYCKMSGAVPNRLWTKGCSVLLRVLSLSLNFTVRTSTSRPIVCLMQCVDWSLAWGRCPKQSCSISASTFIVQLITGFHLSQLISDTLLLHPFLSRSQLACQTIGEEHRAWNNDHNRAIDSRYLIHFSIRVGLNWLL